MIKRLVYSVLLSFSLIIPALANDIYIEQIGDNLDLDIVQDGQDNVIGTSTTAAELSGSGMTFSITQTGNYNEIALNIDGANYEGTWDFSGDSNTVDMLCSSTSGTTCDDVTVDITVGGTSLSDSNEFKIYVGETADASDLVASFTIDGDGNVFDVDVDGTYADISVIVDNTATLASGTVTSENDANLSTSVAGGNIIDLDIDGNGDSAGHSVTLDITGGGSQYTVTQSGVYDNTVNATFNGDNQNVNITQSD